MNYTRVIDRCWEQEKAHFESLGLTKGMLKSIWDIYYNSVKSEVFNEDRTKLFIQHPNIGVFKHGLQGWEEVLNNFKAASSLAKMNQEVKQNGTPDAITDFFRTRFYPFVRKELEIMDYYMECYETYNKGVQKSEENRNLYEKGLDRTYKSMNAYQDKAWQLLQKVKKRDKRLRKRLNQENNIQSNTDTNQNKDGNDESQ